MLVDFDISGDIKWAPGVGKGRLIEKSHGLEVLPWAVNLHCLFFSFLAVLFVQERQVASHQVQGHLSLWAVINNWRWRFTLNAALRARIKASRWSIEMRIQMCGLRQGFSSRIHQ